MIYARHYVSTVINNKDAFRRYTSIIASPISATCFDSVKQPSPRRMYHIAIAIRMIIQYVDTAI